MLRLGKEHQTLNVVNDQIGSPTYTADLAPLLCDMAVSEKFGTYHATNEGICTWAEFAQEIISLAKMNTQVNPIPSSEYPTKAARPLNSRMDKSYLEEAGFKRLPMWKDALKRFIQ
jgi:dTDP-4-dehydrorhamnose reductase